MFANNHIANRKHFLTMSRYIIHIFMCVMCIMLISCDANNDSIDYEGEVNTLLSQDGLGFEKGYYMQRDGGLDREALLIDEDRNTLVVLRVEYKREKGHKSYKQSGTYYDGAYYLVEYSSQKIKSENDYYSYSFENIDGQIKLCRKLNDGKITEIFDEIDAVATGESLKKDIEIQVKENAKKTYYYLFPEGNNQK